jgi:hypothetical protein
LTGFGGGWTSPLRFPASLLAQPARSNATAVTRPTITAPGAFDNFIVYPPYEDEPPEPSADEVCLMSRGGISDQDLALTISRPSPARGFSTAFPKVEAMTLRRSRDRQNL